MAITSSGSFGSSNSKIAGTTIAITATGSLTAGNLAVVMIASDNLTAVTSSNQITSVTDNVVSYNFNTGTGFNDVAYTITSQSDGKILVGGAFTTYGGSEAPGIVRLNANGTIDTAFQNNLDVAGTVYKVIIQPDVTGSYRSGAGTWSAGNPLITARFNFRGAGTQNSALAMSGFIVSGPNQLTSSLTEEYNGVSWAASNNVITGRGAAGGAGIQNAALLIGGTVANGSLLYTCTEEYNGSTWAAGGTLINGRYYLAGNGTQNAALAVGGFVAPIASTVTEEYNGSTWATGGSLIQARITLSSTGTQNAALAAGGSNPGDTIIYSCTEEYNGTSWTATGALINPRNYAAMSGTQNTGLIFGGQSGSLIFSCTEAYNGSTWSSGNAMILGRNVLGGAGSQAASIAFGGTTPGVVYANTEVYLAPVTASISDKIILANNIGSGLVRLNDDGTTDASFGVSGSIINNGEVCAVIVQDVSEYVSNIYQGAWSAGGTMITARAQLAGAGTQNEALAFGNGPTGDITEKYNSGIWSSANNMINARSFLAGAGTQNAALAFGGTDPNGSCTEAYNGSTWTAGGALITTRYALAGAGTQNAALAFGGFSPSPSISSFVSCTEAYNGSTWTAGGALITARYSLAGAGTQTSALAFGGGSNSIWNCTEEYNGSTWAAGGNMICARYSLGGAGTQNAGLAFTGNDVAATSITYTETYNGTIWSTNGAIINARSCLAGAGKQSAALAFGGYFSPTYGSPCSCTEAFTATSYTNKLIIGGTFTSYSGSTYSGSVRLNGDGTIDSSFNIGGGFTGSVDVRCFQFYNNSPAAATVGTWSAGGAMINARTTLAGAGTQNEALSFGGVLGAPFFSTSTCTEAFNGTSWSAGGALIIARGVLAGAGTQNASLAFGGQCGTPGVESTCTEEYNGTSWTAGGALITARSGLAGAGTQNAALAAGGVAVSPVSCTEIYNGTSWSAGGALNSGRQALTGAGTQNAGLAFGAAVSTEEYNGSTWSIGGNMINGGQYIGGAGTQNAALGFGGSPIGNCTEAYNGSTWASGNALITARYSLAGAGSQNAALSFGGYTIPSVVIVACTECITSPSILLAAGNFTGYSGSIRNRLALINLDNGNVVPTASFNIGSAGFNANVNSIAVTSNYQIAAVGNFTSYSGSGTNRIVVINIDGTKDNTFNSGSGLAAEANVVNKYYNGVGIWGASAPLISVRGTLAGAGIQNSGLVFGGIGPTPQSNLCTATEEYNGASWAAGGNLITTLRLSAGAGTQNSGLVFGGIATSTPGLQVACTEKYNGISWTAGNNMISARWAIGSAGNQNAAIGVAGYSPNGGGNLFVTELYNGTSWSSGPTYNIRCGVAGAGTQNSSIFFGGFTPTIPSITNESIKYNGTSFSTSANLIQARMDTAGAGFQDAALAIGGQSGSALSCTEEYNGTAWSAGGALITARCYFAGMGTQNAALAAGVSQTSAAVESLYTTDCFLVGGTFTAYSGSTSSGSARILPGGQRDTTFNIGAGFGTAVDVEEYLIESDADNGIIAVGGFTSYSGSFAPSPTRIVKIVSSGAIDASTIGNTWTKVAERSDGSAAAAGATVGMFYTNAPFGIPAGSIITATISQSVTARAATGWFFNASNAVSYSGASTASQGTNPFSLTLSNLTSGSGQYLFMRGIAIEDANTVTFTTTSLFTASTADGTAGGSGVTNMSIRGEFRIATTASLSSSPTIGTATSNASIYYAFYEAFGKTYFILLD